MVNSSPFSSPPRHKVSVVMPAYCGEKYIAQSIRSALDQTYSDLELIVIDDGSTDRTGEIVQALRAEDSRVVYVYQQNAGQGCARNAGIRIARGDLIGFLDQDDLWESHKLELQIRVMEAAGADVVFSNGFIFSEDKTADESTSFSDWFTPLSGKFDGPSMFGLVYELNRIPILSALVRRDALQKIGLLEGNLQYQNCDDYDLWLRLAEGGATFFGMEEKLVRYRLHSSQASQSNIRMLKSEIAVLEKHRSSPLVSEELKEARLGTLYRTLVEALLGENRADEAQNILKELSRRERTVPFTFFERMLIRTLPGRYRSVRRQLDRAQASFSYRLGRPVKSLYRRVNGRRTVVQ
jgi:teichuronic acid biosynthesis glycosyltransferase TuaG